VIGAVCVHRQLRTTGNVFIVNLALADLIVVTIVQPFNVIGEFETKTKQKQKNQKVKGQNHRHFKLQQILSV